MIRNARAQEVQIQNEINTYSEMLWKASTSQQYSNIVEWCNEHAKKVAELMKRRQIKKFDELYMERFGKGFDPDN